MAAFIHLGKQCIPDTCPHLSQDSAQIAFHQFLHQAPEGEIPHASPMLSHDLVQELLHPFHLLCDSKFFCASRQFLFRITADRGTAGHVRPCRLGRACHIPCRPGRSCHIP